MHWNEIEMRRVLWPFIRGACCLIRVHFNFYLLQMFRVSFRTNESIIRGEWHGRSVNFNMYIKWIWLGRFMCAQEMFNSNWCTRHINKTATAAAFATYKHVRPLQKITPCISCAMQADQKINHCNHLKHKEWFGSVRFSSALMRPIAHGELAQRPWHTGEKRQVCQCRQITIIDALHKPSDYKHECWAAECNSPCLRSHPQRCNKWCMYARAPSEIYKKKQSSIMTGRVVTWLPGGTCHCT